MICSALALSLSSMLCQQDPAEVRVPAMDHGGVQASYVVSLPKAYDPKKAYPLLLDFHGAAPPASKGARITQERMWSKLVDVASWIVVGLNGRTRAWNTIKGENDDAAYALAVLGEVRKSYSIDAHRIYLGGFSSGSDFMCSGGLQSKGPFAGTIVFCSGPSSVVGLKDGSLAKSAGCPFLFVPGEEDHIRKDGCWQAFLCVEALGGKTMYREVPRKAHAFPEVEEVARLLHYLEQLAGRAPSDDLAIARDAMAREDWLLASTHLLRVRSDEARELLGAIEKKGNELVKEAAAGDAIKEVGKTYELWWRVRTQFHRFEGIAARAQKELDALGKAQGNKLGTARRDYFDGRNGVTSRPARASRPAAGATTRPATRAASTGADTGTKAEARWTFDRYLGFAEIVACMQDLAQRFPDKARLVSMGKSIEGRDLWVLEITDRSAGLFGTKPGVYVEGAIHGNEISTTSTVLHLAWQLAANPGKKRGIERLLTNTTFYIAPVVSPDSVHHFMAEPHSYWRPRFNYRPHDADGDGKLDENPYQDLDGDGEITLMYKADPNGEFILKDGHVVRGEGQPRYVAIGREGLDLDGDGRYSEDPPGGVNLNRNFPVGFHTHKDFEGTTGEGPASEPETQAIVGFVNAHPDIALFLDYHNDANCLFYWLGPDCPAEDKSRYEALAARAQTKLGYKPAPLVHAGAGLSIAYGYGERGIVSCIVELENSRGPQEEYLREKWNGDAFIPARPFKHPQLGDILLGNDYRKLAKRNPHSTDILWQAEKNFDWIKEEAEGLARLKLENPRVEPNGKGFVVTGEVVNTGKAPTDTAMAKRLGLASAVALAAEGAKLSGDADLGTLAPGERRAFKVILTDPGDAVTLLVRHPRAGTLRYPVLRARHDEAMVRTSYQVEDGYATPDQAKLADNGFYTKGKAPEERGPAFTLTHTKSELRVAVILGEWKDQRHVITQDQFREEFFSHHTFVDVSPTGQRVYGSVADFYEQMSYGAMKVSGKVFDWLELPGTWAEYRDASFGSDVVQRTMLEAIFAREGPKALDEFDGLAFVWAGNAVVRTSALWPMRLTLKDRPGQVAFKMGELHEGEMAPIGVPCHEMGHTFGVNDKYGLGSGGSPLGECCLMAKGTHGGEPSTRHRPFFMCAWCRMVIGWVKPAVIDPSVPQRLALRPMLFGPGECYRVLLEKDGSEYLLLENRRKEGFLSDFPSPGLVVLHVGPNDKPTAPQTRVQLIPAHGLPPSRRGIVSHPEQLTWPQEARTELVVKGVKLSNIRLVDDVVYFEVGVQRP